MKSVYDDPECILVTGNLRERARRAFCDRTAGWWSLARKALVCAPFRTSRITAMTKTASPPRVMRDIELGGGGLREIGCATRYLGSAVLAAVAARCGSSSASFYGGSRGTGRLERPA